jgi:integrase
MQLSMQEFLDSVINPSTKKGYRIGINKFCEWFGQSPREVLEMRKDDLTQRPHEDLIEYRNRAARFEKEIEKFHGQLLKQGFTMNTARGYTIGIRQLFRFYQMPIRMRTGSRVTKTVKTSTSFPLRIEHVQRMFEVADLRERVILSLATDLGLRISDFITIKKADLPPLDQEPPIMFDVMTGKEHVVAQGFLSAETVELLKIYLPTLQKKENPFLFPSNGNRPISDEWLNRLLQKLAEKAQLELSGKRLTFHCFRKMFLSAAIDAGIGLTAGKKLCGKAIPQSDDTYLTTVKLRDKFVQLKRLLTIVPRVKSERMEQINQLEAAIEQLQKANVSHKTIADVMTKRVTKLEQHLEQFSTMERAYVDLTNRIQPLLDFLESFDSPEHLKYFIRVVKGALEGKGRFVDVNLPQHVLNQIDRVATAQGSTFYEVLQALIDKGLASLEQQYQLDQ